MRPLLILTNARARRDYTPDADLTLDELLQTDPDFNGRLDHWFSSIFVMGLLPDEVPTEFGFTTEQWTDFTSWLTKYASKACYLEYRRRKTFTDDYNEFYDHVTAWGVANSLYYMTKFVAIQKQAANAEGLAKDSETHTEDVTRNGTNESTSSVTSQNDSKERSNNFAVWDTTAHDFDDKTQSHGRNLAQTGNSTGTNNATANATEKRTYTTEHTSSNGRTPIELQDEFVKRISNLTKQIVDDFGQFFNGNLLVY